MTYLAHRTVSHFEDWLPLLHLFQFELIKHDCSLSWCHSYFAGFLDWIFGHSRNCLKSTCSHPGTQSFRRYGPWSSCIFWSRSCSLKPGLLGYHKNWHRTTLCLTRSCSTDRDVYVAKECYLAYSVVFLLIVVWSLSHFWLCEKTFGFWKKTIYNYRFYQFSTPYWKAFMNFHLSRSYHMCSQRCQIRYPGYLAYSPPFNSSLRKFGSSTWLNRKRTYTFCSLLSFCAKILFHFVILESYVPLTCTGLKHQVSTIGFEV